MSPKKDIVHEQMHSKEIDKRAFQKKYMQYQLAKQYIAALVEEKAQLEAKIAELDMTRASMQELKNVDKGEDMLTTLGSDVYMPSSVGDVSSAIIGVGAGVYIRKPIDEAIKTIIVRHAELAEVNRQMAHEITTLSQQIAQLEPEIQAMIAHMQAEEKK